MTASLFKSRWYPLLFPSPPVPLLILWGLSEVHQQQFLSLSLSCSTVSLVLQQGLDIWLSSRFLIFSLCSTLARQSPLISSFSFCCWQALGLVVWPRLGDSFVFKKFMKSFYASFSRTDSGFCIYHFLVWSNLNFLHNSQWITFPSQSCLVLYSFCANFLHLLIKWLIVSSLSPQNPHLLFCCVLSILALT